jgi:hypothetical protein
MENDKVNPNLKVVVEVTGTNYSNGKLKSVFGGKGQINKFNSEREAQNDRDAITIRATDCTPKLEAEYNSTSIGQGEVKTEVELELKGQTYDMNKAELIDAIAAGSKLTKADAGRALDAAIEDTHKLRIERSCDANCAAVDSTYETKTTEITK